MAAIDRPNINQPSVPAVNTELAGAPTPTPASGQVGGDVPPQLDTMAPSQTSKPLGSALTGAMAGLRPVGNRGGVSAAHPAESADRIAQIPVGRVAGEQVAHDVEVIADERRQELPQALELAGLALSQGTDADRDAAVAAFNSNIRTPLLNVNTTEGIVSISVRAQHVDGAVQVIASPSLPFIPA